ncbi:MAG: bifunctional folylpolyglutamate synthase/dihydrofolate synthase [Actinobacteria bacterium]|nr:bifunctional folylpolyglutamate synthase/dihydrofolate synthase [Actinomycetota bacterium]
MKYPDAVNYLFGLQKFGWKLGLDRMQRLLTELGHPERSARIVHIAGTNGKGSVAAMISSILLHAGYRTGLYTSPHLVDVRERIQVDGQMISPVEFAEITTQLEPYIKKLECTFFEAMTALALTYFAKRNVKVAVLEVGLGGRLDATNVVSPDLCVITSISPDHIEHLGSSLQQIAGEKAGILKAGVPCVMGAMPSGAEDSIKKHAANIGSPLVKAGDHCKVSLQAETIYGSKFHLKIDHFYNDQIEIPLPGKHQIENAGIAATGCFVLSQKGVQISQQALKVGCKNVNWPARLQVVSKSPFVVVDVAHNLDSMNRLVDSLTTFFPNAKIVFVFGLLKDKNYKEITKLITPLAEKSFIVQAKTSRALDKEKIAQEFAASGSTVSTEDSVGQGVKKALAAYRDNSVICVTGSHYVVGEAWDEIKYLTGTDNMFNLSTIE